MRLVDANELEKWMNERMRSLRAAYGYHDAYTDGFEECMEAVENAETIVPDILRPTGRWLWNSIDKPVYRICNTCANVYRIFDKECPYNYCPNCGAKMTDNKGETDK